MRNLGYVNETHVHLRAIIIGRDHRRCFPFFGYIQLYPTRSTRLGNPATTLKQETNPLAIPLVITFL